MGEFLSRSFLGNTALDWTMAIILAAVVWGAVRLAVRILLNRIKAFAAKAATDIDDLVAELLEKTKGLFVALVAFFAAGRFLDLPPDVDALMMRLVILGFLFQAAVWANGVVNYGLQSWAQRKFESDPTVVTALGSVGFLLRLGVWATFFMLALDNLGIDVGPLVASLGIGGLALGLALQGTLSDLFASFSIVFDKPFTVGDHIQVAEHAGTVEYVGLKTTRLKSITGEQLVFSNSDLLGSRIHNFQRRDERRAAFTLGVTYDTTPEQLERIPALIQEIVEGREHTRFDRCFFMSFGDSALNIETVYYMQVPDFAIYGATHHAINIEIFRRFAEEGIEFAYPTQTLHVQGVGGRA